MDIDDSIAEVCDNPSDVLSWGEWIEGFKEVGILIKEDNSGFMDTKSLSSREAASAIRRCVLDQAEPESQETATVELIRDQNLTIGEWRAEHTRLSQTTPEGLVLGTENDSSARIELEFQIGRPPLFFGRAYIPNDVCGNLGWFLQSDEKHDRFGWKVILLPKSRDEAIKRLGIASQIVHVKKILIIKLSSTRRSLLGEVAEW